MAACSKRNSPAIWLGAALVVSGLAGFAQARGRLIQYDDAARCGLVRSWYAQAPVDIGRSRVSQWKLYFDRLYAITSSGLLAAFNSETGETLWITSIGAPGAAAFGPGANEEYLAIVSASRLYLVSRSDGHVIWQRQLGSAPAAGPALSEKYAYVALLNGRVEAFQLDDPASRPWYYQSQGRTYLRPTHAGDIISWPTTAGQLYVCSANKPTIRFRLQTNDEIVAPAAEQGAYLYAGSRDGYLYCVHQTTGRERWRFSAGGAIVTSPAVIGDVAYVASREPALYAVNAETGEELWRAGGLDRYVAKGKDRVYAVDGFGNVYALDDKTGRGACAITVAEGTEPIINDQTDRLFLADDAGLIQCLHEAGVETPTKYREPLTAPVEKEEAADAPAANPFTADGDEAGPAEEPADEPVEEDEPVEDVNPFGNPFDAGDAGDLDENPF